MSETGRNIYFNIVRKAYALLFQEGPDNLDHLDPILKAELESSSYLLALSAVVELAKLKGVEISEDVYKEDKGVQAALLKPIAEPVFKQFAKKMETTVIDSDTAMQAEIILNKVIEAEEISSSEREFLSQEDGLFYVAVAALGQLGAEERRLVAQVQTDIIFGKPMEEIQAYMQEEVPLRQNLNVLAGYAVAQTVWPTIKEEASVWDFSFLSE